MTKLERLLQLNKEYPASDKGSHLYWNAYAEYLPDTCDSMLELGVAEGHSAMIWFKYFGKRLDLHLIDLFENKDHVPVRWARENCFVPYQGSESDIEFLSTIKTKFSLIINDASHNVWDQIVSFKHLWTNNLKSKGLFVIEDLHTNKEPFYWDKSKIQRFEDSILWTLQNFKNTFGTINNKFFIEDHLHFEDTISRVEIVNEKIAFIWKK